MASLGESFRSSEPIRRFVKRIRLLFGNVAVEHVSDRKRQLVQRWRSKVHTQ